MDEGDAIGISRGPKGTGRRLRGAVLHYLGSAIVSGRIAPGDRLTSETANSVALDVSRGAYREAQRAWRLPMLMTGGFCRNTRTPGTAASFGRS